MLFTATTFLISSSHSLISVICMLILHLIVSVIYLFRNWKTKVLLSLKTLLIGLLAIVIPVLAIFYKRNTYSQYQTTEDSVIGQFTVVDNTKPWVYIIASWSSQYFLYTDKWYILWEQLFVAWTPKNLQLLLDYNYNYQLSTYQWTGTFDFDKRMLMKWIQWSFFSPSVVSLWTKSLWYIWSLKLYIKQQVSFHRQNINAQSLVLWMVIWDKSKMSKSNYQMFIDSWLVHLIAVSGGNIVILVSFLSIVLFRVPYYLRNCLLIVSIIVYTILCWWDSSIFRSAIMAIIVMLALFVWREIWIFRLLAYTRVLMLVINPYYLLYDLWFLLSFSAIVWIVLFSKITSFIANRQTVVVKESVWSHSIATIFDDMSNKGNIDSVDTLKIALNKQKSKEDILKLDKVDKLWTLKTILSKALVLTMKYIWPTLWATLWVLPIVLYFIWSMNLFWVVANFVILPFVPIIMIGWLVIILLWSLFWLFWSWYFVDNIIVTWSQIIEKISDLIFMIWQFFAEHWLYIFVHTYSFKIIILIVWLRFFYVEIQTEHQSI